MEAVGIGILRIQNRILRGGFFLKKLGVETMDAVGQPFDPEKHNAVMHIEDESYGENTVVEVLQQGFTLGDKVLRFAIVKVAN